MHRAGADLAIWRVNLGFPKHNPIPLASISPHMGPNFEMTASNTQPGVLVYTKCQVEGKPDVLEHQILGGRDYHISFGGWIDIQTIYGKSSCSPMYPYTRIQVHIRLLVYVYICIYKKHLHKHPGGLFIEPAFSTFAVFVIDFIPQITVVLHLSQSSISLKSTRVLFTGYVKKTSAALSFFLR